MEPRQDPTPPIEIPSDQLSPEALLGVIESFIVRDGTDYGREEVPHEKKVERLRKQITTGTVKIVFDPDTESVTLLTRQEWLKLRGDL